MENYIEKCKKKFSAELKKCIEKSNLSQEEVAKKLQKEKINVNRSAVSRWVNGVSLPRIDVIYALSQIFNCSMDDLLGKL